ncbi:MAG: TlpA disulfide reductase family protein [Caldimonas sp.]
MLAGAGVGIWQYRDHGSAQSRASPSLDVWTQTFESLAGPVTAMRAFHGRPLLLNFWATWCAPCVTEMPLLDAFFMSQPASSWHVLALAIDQRPAVEGFVRDRGLKLPVAFAAEHGVDLSRDLGNKLGALPFTVAFGSDGHAAATKLGSVTQDLLSEWTSVIK